LIADWTRRRVPTVSVLPPFIAAIVAALMSSLIIVSSLAGNRQP
jgi:hypothetical protein